MEPTPSERPRSETTGEPTGEPTGESTDEPLREPTAAPRRASRRRRLLLAGLVALGVLPIGVALSSSLWIPWLGGHSEFRALSLDPGLSPEAAALVERALGDLGPGTVIDVHAHLAGRGPDSGCWIHPRLEDPLNPKDYVRMRIFRSAGLPDAEAPDRAWIERLGGLASHLPLETRHHVLPFDHRYHADGTRDLEHSDFYVPLDWALEAERAFPERLVAAASVHPYRPDCVAELERAAAAGARLVKWLPSAQAIDPADPACDAAYAAMARLGLVLLVHCGDEGAVGDRSQLHLGNPLRLRRALAAGVQVVIAHCGVGGSGEDLDHPGAQPVPNVELFLRLMDEPEWEGLLFGGISTVAQVNRFPIALPALLGRPDLHPRLVNGSDWPLPAVNLLVHLGPLVEAGYLEPADRGPLEQLYHHDPLLFDLVLKRVLRDPGTGVGFADVVFLERPGLPL